MKSLCFVLILSLFGLLSCGRTNSWSNHSKIQYGKKCQNQNTANSSADKEDVIDEEETTYYSNIEQSLTDNTDGASIDSDESIEETYSIETAQENKDSLKIKQKEIELRKVKYLVARANFKTNPPPNDSVNVATKAWLKQEKKEIGIQEKNFKKESKSTPKRKRKKRGISWEGVGMFFVYLSAIALALLGLIFIIWLTVKSIQFLALFYAGEMVQAAAILAFFAWFWLLLVVVGIVAVIWTGIKYGFKFQ